MVVEPEFVPVRLEFTPDGLSARLHGNRHVVPTTLIEQSVLLKNLAEDPGDVEEVSVPVGERALEAWLEYNSGTTAPPALHDLLTVVKAADFLDDARTSSKALTQLAELLFLGDQDASSTGERAINEVLSDLPEHTAVSLLSRAPRLAPLLNAVAPHHHPLALRAHLPAIDTHATLALTTDMPLLCHRAARAAAAAFPHLTHVSLCLTMPPTKTVCFDGETLRLLTALPALRALELKRLRVSVVNARGLEHAIGPCFARLPALERLSLQGALASLQPLAPHVPALGCRLTALDLSANPLSEGSFQALATHVGSLTALRELSLARTWLEERSWNLIAPKLPPLATLDLSDAYIDRVSCLAECDGALDPARFWERMEALDLGFGHLSEGLDRFGDMLACMPGLRRLSLAHALPSARATAEAMLRDLATLSRLSALDISAGSMRLVASDAFVACMRVWAPCLQELRLRSANGSVDAARDSMHALCAVPLPALVRLDLAYSDLRDEGVSALAEGFSAMCALSELQLQQVRATAEGAANIARHVSALQCLEVLQLHRNAVLGEGLVAVVEAAGALPRLRILGMNSVCGPRAPRVVVIGRDDGATEEAEGLVELPRPLKMQGRFTLQLLRGDFCKAARAGIEQAAAEAGVTVELQ